MIVGLGIDLVELARIERSLERFGEHFLRRLLHEEELAALPAAPVRRVAYVSARFAAKEAASKALGTGFTGGIGLHDIRIHSLPSGKPEMTFHNQALRTAEALGVTRVHLTLTHARATSAAAVILERLTEEQA